MLQVVLSGVVKVVSYPRRVVVLLLVSGVVELVVGHRQLDIKGRINA